jgi:hypothetical protein
MWSRNWAPSTVWRFYIGEDLQSASSLIFLRAFAGTWEIQKKRKKSFCR